MYVCGYVHAFLTGCCGEDGILPPPNPHPVFVFIVATFGGRLFRLRDFGEGTETVLASEERALVGVVEGGGVRCC